MAPLAGIAAALTLALAGQPGRAMPLGVQAHPASPFKNGTAPSGLAYVSLG
jgi:hypothetical protein